MSEFQFLTDRSWPSNRAMRSEYTVVTGVRLGYKRRQDSALNRKT
jgi:hypothetical protein